MTAPVASPWRERVADMLKRLETMQPPNVLLQQITMLGEAAGLLREALASPAGEGGLPELLDEDAAVIRGLESIANDPERGLWSQSLSRGALRIIRRLATTAGVQGDTEIAHIAYDFLLAAGYDMDSAPLNKIKAAAATPPPAPAAEQRQLPAGVTFDHDTTRAHWPDSPDCAQPEARGVGMVLVPRIDLQHAAETCDSWLAMHREYVRVADIERWEYPPGIEGLGESLRHYLAAAPAAPGAAMSDTRDNDDLDDAAFAAALRQEESR